MKALLFTNDPYEPSGVIGLFETEEQKRNILEGYKKYLIKEYPSLYQKSYNFDIELSSLKEIEIPIGIYGEYY